MAKKISQLTQATQVKSDDVTVIVQDGETKKLPLNMMVTKQDIENKKVAGLAKLDEIEATYENDTYTPTITVKNKSSVKVGEGDGVDYSANVMDGHAKSAILKGSTKYRDIDTGEVLDAFEDGRNLELVSVKMPVLTTTGKNLFDKTKILENSVLEGTSNTVLVGWIGFYVSDYIPVKKNEPIFIPATGSSRKIYCDKNKEYVRQITHSDTYFTPEFDGFIRLTFKDVDFNTYQLEYNAQATSYEPYKSNTLTVNEDVTLRSNGSVCDELDLLTGKLTQRIDEDGEILTQEVVKTVDLIPSGTRPSTTPYCWKDGHIQLSSSGLLPNLEYSVVTSRAGQISQNAAMIVKNDKRIFDLEILLAGGLVNTTYQALTLQNQVETGLSKVSLSSEKEPDYLLYHMIMKLIEEKAYKLDDLTEKVSVFYLYEKLSDEQFETIYSELYPFVEEEYIELPEDGEIIEEPIVDEVLEEVENGVVM